MRKTSTWLLEQGTQTPSPAPDLIPAETRTENSHWDWYSERGHFKYSSTRACNRERGIINRPTEMVVKCAGNPLTYGSAKIMKGAIGFLKLKRTIFFIEAAKDT